MKKELMCRTITQQQSECPGCSAEITFKTDPKNGDYAAEHGATRNFEPWKSEPVKAMGEFAEEKEEEPKDPMKALEGRTLESKREMDISDALEEILTRNARSERVDVDDVLDRFSAEDKDLIQERLAEEEFEYEKQATAAFQSGDGERVRKLKEDIEPDAFTLVIQSKPANGLQSFKPSAIQALPKKPADKHQFGIQLVKRKQPDTENQSNKKNKSSANISLVSYGFDSSDSDNDSS